MKMNATTLSSHLSLVMSRIQNFLALVNDRLLDGTQLNKLTLLWEEIHQYPKCQTLVLKGERQGQVCGKACVKDQDTCMCHAPRPPKKEVVAEHRDRCSVMVLKGQCQRFVVTDGKCAFHQPKEIVTCSFVLKSGKRNGTECGKPCTKTNTMCARHESETNQPAGQADKPKKEKADKPKKEKTDKPKKEKADKPKKEKVVVEPIHVEEKVVVEPVHVEEKMVVEPVHVEEKVVVEPVHVEEKVVVEPVHVEEKVVFEPVHVEEKVIVEPVQVEEKVVVEPVQVVVEPVHVEENIEQKIHVQEKVHVEEKVHVHTASTATCDWLMKSGTKKGQLCGKKCVADKSLCVLHM